jgi:hypothetical protein
MWSAAGLADGSAAGAAFWGSCAGGASVSAAASVMLASIMVTS